MDQDARNTVAVVATLWPVRDEDAVAFARAFAHELGRGRSLAAANAAAERAAIRAGRPVAAWAGAVVLGDGGLVLRPGGVPHGGPGALWLAALMAAAAAAAAAGFAVARRRGRRRAAAAAPSR